MDKKENFINSVVSIAIPVALQSMLQSSFSIIDQLMIGQLGDECISGIGLAGKFTSIFGVVVGAVGTVAGIYISQYLGAKKEDKAARSMYINGVIAMIIATIFLLLSLSFSKEIIGIYIDDANTILIASNYLRIVALAFYATALSTILSTMLRSLELAVIPLIASLVAVVLNTLINYILIFGKFGAPRLGVEGAAIATVVSGWVNFIIIFVGLILCKKNIRISSLLIKSSSDEKKKYIYVLLPILVNEFLWSLGENIYAVIYGHLGTKSLAAMTLSYPIQGLLIGALSGLSGAATVIVGKKLGADRLDEAYSDSKKLMLVSFIGAAILSFVLILCSRFYVSFYKVDDTVRKIAIYVLIAFAMVAPFKVLNMVLGGGILRSGGETKLVMYIDIIGTWLFGIPLGLLTSNVFNLPIYWVYFILSLEEVIRFIISFIIFRNKKWMKNIDVGLQQ